MYSITRKKGFRHVRMNSVNAVMNAVAAFDKRISKIGKNSFSVKR